jgi:hypothetical protein
MRTTAAKILAMTMAQIAAGCSAMIIKTFRMLKINLKDGEE